MPLERVVIFRAVLLFVLGGALGLLGGCGPIYDLRYEYEKPANAERSCFAHCVTGRSHCRQLGRLGDVSRRDREVSLCLALAGGEKDDERRAKRMAECGFAAAPPVYSGTDCELDYNDCFIACGGTVIEIQECVANCEGG